MPLDPIDIRIYTGLITQNSTEDPTLIELFNTTGYEMISTRISTGVYMITTTGADNIFTTEKVGVFITPSVGTTAGYIAIQHASGQMIHIQTGLAGVPTDGLLYQDTFEIRIYYY